MQHHPGVLPSGIVLLRSLLQEPLLGAYRDRIEPAYRRDKPEGFVPTASSFPLRAIFSGPEFESLRDAILNSSATPWISNELNDRVICDPAHAWVRRQFAPAHYPALHAPHGWHQDGALGFNFAAYPDGNYPTNALLSMVTCWFALDCCGVEAPGLEIVGQRLAQLLAPAELADERVRKRFPAECFWCPCLNPGDALLFRGDILHRTHVQDSMLRDRTSIELRFFES
jgi:hypothetical protein